MVENGSLSNRELAGDRLTMVFLGTIPVMVFGMKKRFSEFVRLTKLTIYSLKNNQQR